MKNFKKIIATLLLLAMMGTLCACFKPNDGGVIEVDPDKTQLYVFSYAGGVGNDWLDSAIAAFEAKYANTSFEEGKMGVQVIPDKQKVTAVTMMDSFKNSTYDVIFNENLRYNQWAANGNFLDITDLVNEVGEDGKSIYSKLSADKLEALTARDGKIYALPHYEAFRGLVYDIDLFDENNLYFAYDRTYSDFILSANATKSAGPDGKMNTLDDGLPATYEEFFKLCDEMVSKGITPFVWSGEQNAYSEFLLYALADTWAGAEETKLNYNFGVGSSDNTTTVVTGFSNGQPVTKEVAISEANGYELRQTEAKYRALEFLFKIFNTSDYYYTDSMAKLTMSNREAQETYIFSKLENKPIAMLIEGTFWEKEAKDSFDLSVSAYGDAAKNRNFGWMPLPGVYSGTVDESNGTTQVLNDYINAYCGINANSTGARLELAKLFVKFIYTDEMLNDFTKHTGMLKGVNYDIASDTTNGLSGFYKQLIELRKESEVITPLSSSVLFINNETKFTLYDSYWNSDKYIFPIAAFRGGQKSAITYFEGMEMTQADWEAAYGRYYQGK